MQMVDREHLKMEAAKFALSEVCEDMHLGIGTGSTIEYFIRFLGERVSSGLRVTGVATSERTARSCSQAGIPLLTLDDISQLDLVVDGADEIAPDFSLIKGGGGAFLREKIVASAADRMVIIADSSKLVSKLGCFPLPIEVEPFGLPVTLLALEEVGQKLGISVSLRLREKEGQPFLTDGGHFVVDAFWSCISNPKSFSAALHDVPGVLAHGLFVGFADVVIVADHDGVRKIHPLHPVKSPII